MRWCVRIVDDSTARSDRCLEPCLDVLTCDRHVDVHRVPQRLGLIEFLHSDRPSVTKGVDRIVSSRRLIAAHSAPEADVNRFALRRDG